MSSGGVDAVVMVSQRLIKHCSDQLEVHGEDCAGAGVVFVTCVFRGYNSGACALHAASGGLSDPFNAL
jgi:hypothetical protein